MKSKKGDKEPRFIIKNPDIRGSRLTDEFV